MWEPNNVIEKKFNNETHRLVGEAQLREYGLFLETFNENINKNKKKFSNIHNIKVAPVLLQCAPNEGVSILRLTHSDNKILSKILTSLASLCMEINLLVEEGKQFSSNFIYYKDENGKSVENVETVSKIIESLQKMHRYIDRCQQVIVLLMKQLCAILNKGFYVSNSTSSFPEVFRYFSELLVCLLTLDKLLESEVLKSHWFLYRRSIRNILHNCSQYDLSANEVRLFDKHLALMESDLLNGAIFKNVLEKYLDEKLISKIKSSSLNAEFSAYINTVLSDLEKDEDNIFFTQLWLQLNCIVVFSFHIFGTNEKRTIKRLLDINKRSSACTLIGNVIWYPEEFLVKHLPSLSKSIDLKSISSTRISQINTRSSNVPREAQNLCLLACHWMTDIEKLKTLNMSNLNQKHLQDISNLLMDGLRLIKKVTVLSKWITNLHTDKKIPITKSVIVAICKLLEVLKGIQIIFNKNIFPLMYIILLLTQQMSHKALVILHGIRKNFTQEKSYKEHQLDVLSALNICEHALKGPSTSQRLMIANLSLSASGLPSETLTELRSTINRLELISGYMYMLNEVCECSFLYWHQMYVLPVYFSKLVDLKADLSRCYLLLNALTDCALKAGEKVTTMTDAVLKSNLYEPINHLVETNLRLQTHLHLQLTPGNPFSGYHTLNFAKFSPAPLKIQYKNLKNEAEHYLSTTFYNLTTVILHDWKTYGEMRKLASLQYNLDTVDDNLPVQTLEQGLDVLEIMRNIDVFVGKYLYNLNSQVFVEESSENKFLNSINISHVANSIRTHGIGIMNTTVNFTYQFLQKKFYIFSQFMFDEHIKSRLLKDLRFFNDNKDKMNQMYPYERAEKFNTGIRKLGLNQNGQSYLDLFRIVVTQIGNAMGYIRLIRSGGRRCLADGTFFIPDLKDIDNLGSVMKEDDLPEMSKKASDGLMQDLQSLVDNFEEATEYFKLLVKVFVPVFRNKNNMHLKNFYVIVPPLTINFIEHSLTCKERLNKKNKADCAFSDDGFALGLAYIVELLDQESQLNSLHWFLSIQKEFKNNRLKVNQQKAVASNDNSKLQQTLALTEKRIISFEREFQLLYYSFSSARLFFQS